MQTDLTIRLVVKWIFLVLEILDTNASASCLQSKNTTEFSSYGSSHIVAISSAADGVSQSIVGVVRVFINFRAMSKPISNYIVPSLSRI